VPSHHDGLSQLNNLISISIIPYYQASVEQLAMDATITPAAELASENAAFNLSTSENEIVHPDWSHVIESYDQDYERQVATIQNRMQRYGFQ
jgi:hypothetical protein